MLYMFRVAALGMVGGAGVGCLSFGSFGSFGDGVGRFQNQIWMIAMAKRESRVTPGEEFRRKNRFCLATDTSSLRFGGECNWL